MFLGGTRPRVPTEAGEPSMPELLLLGIEEIDVDRGPGFQLVPSDSATADLTRALDDLIKGRRPK